MLILGVDTAIRCTGYGLVEFRAGNFKVLDCGIIRNKASAPHSECLRRIGGGIREIVEKFKPDVAAIESAFYSKNVKTSMILSYARGAIMFVLAEKKIPIFAYAPRKAKMAVCGSGASSKKMVASMMASLLGMDLKEIPLDSTDALAIAICHGQIACKPGAEYFLQTPL
jgi:crossover junction endodeoxyribonuclease RuvC